MYHVSDQGIDERMINVHYYYYYVAFVPSARKNGGVTMMSNKAVHHLLFLVFVPAQGRPHTALCTVSGAGYCCCCHLSQLLFPFCVTASLIAFQLPTALKRRTERRRRLASQGWKPCCRFS